ncbi:hypothetical protein KP509_21G022000 [Ceratopteris richardii]|uniref:Uncharacterized protein n=1 Tax=Ceratopteris richardii TaxID=49495 RepID=A0A8T2SA00_CERRI|nr:hypothetical protein KP509_21G022000 [Ceratopteris richardii]
MRSATVPEKHREEGLMVISATMTIGAAFHSVISYVQHQHQMNSVSCVHQWRPFLPWALPSRGRRNPSLMILLRARGNDSSLSSSAARASSDSTVTQVALEEDLETTSTGKPSALDKGGVLTAAKAAAKNPSSAPSEKPSPLFNAAEPFSDARWKNGTWDLQHFTEDGKINWDAVIDAEVMRRKWLEDSPDASTNEDPVVFDTSSIPWWAWVKRFHLPEAELLNGRAAMVGFFMGYVVDSLTGAGLVDQTSNFFGKLLLFISVLGVLFVRKNGDIETLKQLAQEWTFYDRQWQATWQDEQRASSKQD